MIVIRSQKRASQLGKLLIHLFLLLVGLLFALPLIWQISSSLKIDKQLFVFPPIWIPQPVDWQNYPEALAAMPFVTYVGNTLWIALWNVIGIQLSCIPVAYGLSRIQWPGRNLLFVLVLATMMMPYPVTMIPLYILFKNLGWIGTMKPLIVPAFLGGPFFIFLLRQFFMTIPMELSDAATIDGCSHLQILRHIILPLAKPVLATVALFTFMANWNDFLGPLIYLSDDAQYTLSIGLQRFLVLHQAKWAYLMAASTVFTIPIIVLFFFTQRTFIQGITLTGLKG
ncbi:MAG: carbohydrate ABC transporter permease [Caldilineaceae bacterium]